MLSYYTPAGPAPFLVCGAFGYDCTSDPLEAQANGLADSAGLEEGQVLRIPAVVVTSTNNDDGTFEAYDPTAVIGDTTPIIPQPPKKKKNWLKQLVIVVVIVVVAAMTQQWWLTTYGTPTATTAAGVTLTGSAATSAVAAGTATATGFTAGSMLVGGAIGGAVGSVAGQLTGMALGEQDSFSWKQVGLGALGGGITGGLSTVSALSNSALGGAFQGAATRAAISSAVTQGIGVATGLQESFSWRSVGLSAVSAGITEGLGEHWGGGANWQNNSSLSNTTKFAIDAGSRLVGNTVAQAVTNKGGKVEWGRVLADSFGTAIGNAIPRGIVSGGSQQEGKAAQVNQTQGSGLSLNAPGGSGLKLTPSAVQAFLNRPDMQLGGGSTQSVESTYYPQPGDTDFIGPMLPVDSYAGEDEFIMRLKAARDGILTPGEAVGSDYRSRSPRNANGKVVVNRFGSPESGSRPSLADVRGYGQTYPALQSQINELDSLVGSGFMSREDADQALLNSTRATSTLKSDYEVPLKTTASMSAWDGVDRKAQAQASLNKNLSEAVLLPVAATIPVLQTTRLAAYGLGTVYSTVGWKGAAAISGATTVAMDAGMQYAITGEVRPEQTAFAGLVGTVSGPLAATGSLFTNVVLGGAGAALNTQFQNSYYGEDKKLGVPVLMGGIFGTLGYKVGERATKALSYYQPERYFVNLNSQVPALFQPIVINQVPQYFGLTSGGFSSGLAPLGESAYESLFSPAPKKP